MTSAQEKALRYLRRVTREHMHPGQHVRELYVEELDWGPVSVRVVLSTENPQSIGYLFPATAHWFVSPRGGISFYRRSRRSFGFDNVRVCGTRHAWGAFYAHLGRAPKHSPRRTP